MVLFRGGGKGCWLATVEPVILSSMRAFTKSTMSMRKHPIMAVVAAIMVGGGDFKLKYAPAKPLFLWVLPSHNLCGGAQRRTSLASGPSAYLTAA